MAQTNVQAFSGDVEIANTLTVSDDIIVDDGTNPSLTIDASSSMIYNKQLYFGDIAIDSYNYLGRFDVYAPPAIFNILDSGTALGSGSRYSMSKGYGQTQPPIMNALEGSEYTTYRFYWEPEAAGGGSEESIFYHVWFSPSMAGNYTFYIHAKDYLFPTEPSSPTYNDVVYGMLNLLGQNGTQSHVVVGRPRVSGNATLQLHNESQTTGDRLTHEAIQLFSNTTPATGDVSNVFITMTPSINNGGYGGYIEGWIESGSSSGLSLGDISSGTKYRGLTIKGGRVGIGTTNPRNGLDVRTGDGTASDTYATFGKAVQASAGWSGIRLGTPYASAHDAYCSVIESYNDHSANYNSQLRFKTSSGNNAVATERMRITSAGNVGIGTDNPITDFNLTLYNSATNNNCGLKLNGGNGIGQTNFRQRGTSITDRGLQIESLPNAGTGKLLNWLHLNTAATGWVNTLAIKGNTDNLAYVGVGTDNPTSHLHIEGTTMQQYRTKEYHYNWGGNNVRRFSIPVTGASSRGSYTVECEASGVAANGSSEKKATFKGYISHYGSGTTQAQVDESLNNYSFHVSHIGTGNNAAGTLRIDYRPDAGYQQNVNTTMFIKVRYAAATSGFGDLSVSDLGSNYNLTASTYASRALHLPRFVYPGDIALIQTFSGSTPEGTFDNSNQVKLTSIGPGAGTILMYANLSGYHRTGSRCYTYAAGKNLSGGNMVVDLVVQSAQQSSSGDFFPQIFVTPTAGASADVYIRSSGSEVGGTVVWRVAMYRM